MGRYNTTDGGGRVFIYPEAPSFGTGDTVKIIANRIHHYTSIPGITFDNPSARFIVANNFIHCPGSDLGFHVNETDSVGNPNVFINNTVYLNNNNSSCSSPGSYTLKFRGVSNDNFVNNIIRTYSTSSSTGCGGIWKRRKIQSVFLDLGSLPGMIAVLAIPGQAVLPSMNLGLLPRMKKLIQDNLVLNTST